ncbi:MAG TPA: hypothetical protein VFZ53_05845 [Polyangiaceae bacterium]
MKVLELVRGGTLRVLEMNGEHVVVRSSHSSPPGSPLEAVLDAGTLRIKVRSCQKVDADEAGRAYRIEGRFVSLTRAQRESLGASE